MSSRDWTLRIQDILTAIYSIQSRTLGMEFEAFAANETVVKAVLYDFIILGEASASVPEDIQRAHPELPWRLMKDMRNIAAHEYFQVDLPTVWRTLQYSLPPLIAPLEQMLLNQA